MKRRFGKFNLRSPFVLLDSEQSPNLPVTTGNFKEDKEKPITPGRETEDPNDIFFTNQKYSPVEPGFAIEWLSVLENLAVYNQDVGFAVDNIVQLANTDYHMVFADGISKTLRKEINRLIADNKNNWYSFSGGFHSFRSDILAQAAINGAMSCELIPNKRLDNIKLVRIPPKYIRFLYNKNTEDYDPFQEVKRSQNSDPNTYGLKSLNTVKYKYIAWRRLLEGPYPIPPFLTAVRSLDIQQHMVKNLSFIIEKLGMLGFLSVTVEPPSKKPNESDTVYYNRCLNYLETKVYPQIQKNLSSGIAVGYKGSHEFQMQANNMNVAGAQNLVKIVETMLFAGLKQDPNMLGRNFSTTETFGRVILAKMTNQVRDYQNMLNQLTTEIFKMFITLRGYDPNIIMGVECEPAMINDKTSEETARGTEIDNAYKLRDGGIIDQQTAATELGYEEPADKEFLEKKEADKIADREAKKNQPAPDDSKDGENKTEDKETEDTQQEIKVVEGRLKVSVPEYNYDTLDCHNIPMNLMKSSNFHDPVMNKFAKGYAGAVYTQYSKFIMKARDAALKAIEILNPLTALETIQENVYLAVLVEWENSFSTKLTDITKNNVEDIYTHYRKDTSIFGTQQGFSKSKRSFAGDFEIPDAIFGLDDFRSIEYMAESDTMYLGKFITDQNTKKKVYKYLEEQYINGDLPFGNNPEGVNKFKNDFSKKLDLEAYKIRRVIDTSVNNIRNDANVQYINQAELSEYEVIEIGDERTCQYCNHMNGMVFDVGKAVSKINNKISSTPENVSTLSPFATTVKIDEFSKMDADQLQAAGFSTPSYHASCRGRIVAK